MQNNQEEMLSVEDEAVVENIYRLSISEAKEPDPESLILSGDEKDDEILAQMIFDAGNVGQPSVA